MPTAYTSNRKIGGLDAASSVAGTDSLIVEKSGDTLRATVNQLVDNVFTAKTSGGTPANGDVVVIRRGSSVLQLTTENLIPAGAIANAQVSNSAAIVDSKLAKITTPGKVGGGAITDGTIGGSTVISTSGAIGTSTNLSCGNATVGGNLTVNFATTLTGLLTANGGISGSLAGNATTATTLATGRTIALTGDVTGTTGAFNGSANVSAATTIANNAVTTAKIADANVTTAKIADANVTTAKIATNAVDNTKIRDSVSFSVIGRSANTSGDPADIQAGTDGHVLRRSGTTLGFGTVDTTGIADGAITNAKVGSAAAIAGTKISPDFGSQNAVTTGTITAAKLIPTGGSASGNGMYLPAANTVAVSTSGSERYRINSSGVVLLGATSNVQADTTGVQVNPWGQVIVSNNLTGSCVDLYRINDGIVQFFVKHAGAGVGQVITGSIGIVGSTTVYNTTSDYRLKSNVADLENGLSVINSLQPRRYQWIPDSKEGVGFIAHELQQIVPDAVSGEKDAVDDKGKIMPQGVDQSKLVPYLVAAVQELSDKVASLEAKLKE